MKPWARELAALAFVALCCAYVTPRALLPAMRPRPLAHPAPEPPPTVVTYPVQAPAAPPPAPDAPDAADASREAPRGHHGAARVEPVPRVPGAAPGALAHRNGTWVADLAGMPPLREVLTGASIEPPGEGPQREGYRVASLDRHGLMRAAGIRPGDVLVAVNGLPLRTPDEALDALGRLREASRASFEFLRGGERYRVPVEVRRDPRRPLVE